MMMPSPTSSFSLKVLELESCGSTNDEAWLHFQEAHWDGNPMVVTAQNQTKGRGRQGRAWDSSLKGNLYASLLCTPPLKALSWIPLAAGVAAMRSIVRVLAEAGASPTLDGLRLKWPNDIAWHSKKLGGILCESRFAGDQCLAMVVGLGLNIQSYPDLGAPLQASSLARELAFEKHGIDANWFRTRFLKLWCLDFLHWSALLDLGSTWEIQAAWNEWAKLKSHPLLQTHGPDGILHDLTAVGLDASGKLKALWKNAELGDQEQVVFLDQADSFAF